MASELIWKVYTKEETERLAADFEQALHNNEAERVSEYLRDSQLARSLVVRRGEGNKYFNLLEKAAVDIFEKKTEAGIEDPIAVVKYLHEKNIPEQILNELENIAYHQRDEKKFFSIIEIIKSAAGELENKNVLARAIHDSATWLSAHGELTRAVEENKRALELARANGEPVIELKSKFGLTHDKAGLKPRFQTEDFLQYAENLASHGLLYDAIQSKIEAARTLLQSALLQEPQLKEQRLNEAKDIALEGLKNAKDIEYPNAEVRAREILSEIYDKIEENRKVKSYKKGADKIRTDFDYKSTPLTK